MAFRRRVPRRVAATEHNRDGHVRQQQRASFPVMRDPRLPPCPCTPWEPPWDTPTNPPAFRAVWGRLRRLVLRIDQRLVVLAGHLLLEDLGPFDADQLVVLQHATDLVARELVRVEIAHGADFSRLVGLQLGHQRSREPTVRASVHTNYNLIEYHDAEDVGAS